MGTGRFFWFFSRMWQIGAIESTDKIGERAKLYPTPMLALKQEEMKLFQIY